MKPDSISIAVRWALGVSVLLCFPHAGRAQNLPAPPAPMDERERQRAERDAKKAAEQEEGDLKATVDKERREAEAAARDREKATARLIALEEKSQAPGPAKGGSAENLAPPPVASSQESREKERIQKAEEKARGEAEKARKKEEDRARAQEEQDAKRRRKDEERAQREAEKARQADDKARAAALKKEQQGAGSSPAPSSSAPLLTPPGPDPIRAGPLAEANREPLSKEEEKRRRELVKQIEKARAERDRLNREAEAAEGIARTARNAASEGQRAYEALATGLDVEDVSPPPPASPETETRRNRFVTKADERQATASRNAPQTTADPLRIALDLKNPDAEARQKAAFALASLGPDAQPATRALMAALADPTPAVRVAAAQALGRIGPGAAAAMAPLSAALTDPDGAVKNAAQAALLAIEGR